MKELFRPEPEENKIDESPPPPISYGELWPELARASDDGTLIDEHEAGLHPINPAG